MPAQRRDRMRSLVAVMRLNIILLSMGWPRAGPQYTHTSISLSVSCSLSLSPLFPSRCVRMHTNICYISLARQSLWHCSQYVGTWSYVINIDHKPFSSLLWWWCAVCNSYFSTFFRCFTCTKTVIIIWFWNEQGENGEGGKIGFRLEIQQKKWTTMLIESVGKVVHSHREEKRMEAAAVVAADRKTFNKIAFIPIDRTLSHSHLPLIFYYYVVHTSQCYAE